jgi:hypothetical protein
MIRIRLYREGDDSWNRPIIKKQKKGKKNTKKEKKKKRKKANKRIKKGREKEKKEDTCTIADEQPSTLGVPDFRKVLGYRSPQR